MKTQQSSAVVGIMEGVHVPTEKSQKQRSIRRFRKKLWGDMVRAKNRLKSELKFQGIEVPQKYDNPHWSHNFMNWISQQADNDPYLRDTLLVMLEEIRALRLLLLKTQRRLGNLSGAKHTNKKVSCFVPYPVLVLLLQCCSCVRYAT